MTLLLDKRIIEKQPLTETPMSDSPEDFTPDFAKGGGLLPVIAQDAHSLEVLMLAFMNKEAYEKTLQTYNKRV